MAQHPGADRPICTIINPMETPAEPLPEPLPETPEPAVGADASRPTYFGRTPPGDQPGSPPSGEASSPAGRGSRTRSLARLLVGSALTGAEELQRQLSAWEDELEALRSPAPAQPEPGAGLRDEPFVFSQPPADESSAVLLRYALIGWLMEREAMLGKRLSQAGRLSRGLWKLANEFGQRANTGRVLGPLAHSRFFNPLRRQYDDFLARGETELERWIALGRQEELHSRDLSRLATKRTVDESIEYLAQNPQVEQLVETQSTGLANEVVEEVRERTVSADTFVESLVRTLLHRTPRGKLPEPPAPVQHLADGFRADAHPGKKKNRGR